MKTSLITRSTRIAILLATTCTISSRSAQQSDTPWEKSAIPAAKLGYGLTRAIVGNQAGRPPPPTSSFNQNTITILSSVQSKLSDRDTQITGIELAAANTKFAIGTIAAGLSASGVGLIYAGMVDGFGNWIVDVAAEHAATKTQEKTAAFIAATKTEILEATGAGNMEDLQTSGRLDRDKLKKTVASVKRVKEFLDNQGDDETRKLAVDVIVEGILTANLAMVDQIDTNRTDIASVNRELSGFVKETKSFRKTINKTLSDHTKALNSLGKHVADLKHDVANTNETLEQHGNELAFLSDFAFSQMSAAQKTDALENGFMSKRFEGKEDVKAQLISQFKKEALVQKHVGNLKSFAQDLAGVNQIAQNLGVESKSLSAAVSYSSAVATAAQAFTTGNWIGGLAAITGVFGKKRPDPDAERFRILMGYLEDQFAEVNEKLNILIEGQKQLFQGLTQLSEQMTRQNEILEQRIDRIAFDVKNILDLTRMSVWKEWRACYAVYSEAHRKEIGSPYGGLKYSYKQDGDFATIDEIIEVATNTANTRNCIEEAEQAFTSLSTPGTFDSFISLRFAVAPEVPTDHDNNNPDTFDKAKSALENYLYDHYDPIIKLIAESRSKTNLNWSQLLALSSVPAYDFQQDRNGPSVRCSSRAEDKVTLSETVGPGIGQLLCAADATPVSREKNAETLLNKPTAYPAALNIADWMLVASRTADVWDNVGLKHYGNSGLFLQAVQGGNWDARQSIKLLQGTDSVLSYVLATSSIIFGAEAVEAIIYGLSHDECGETDTECLADTESRKSTAFKLISRDKYLAQNVITKLLRDNFIGSNTDGVKTDIATGKIPFEFAYNYAATTNVRPVSMLQKLFKTSPIFDIRYSEAPEFPQVCVGPKVETRLCVLMPSYVALNSGVLHYPRYIYEIAAKRGKVRARIADYDSFKGLDGLNANENEINDQLVDLVRYGS